MPSLLFKKGERLKLTIMETIHVSRLLPNKGNYDLIKATMDFKKILTFSEEEVRRFDIMNKQGGFNRINFINHVKSAFGFNDEQTAMFNEILKQHNVTDDLVKQQQMVSFNLEASNGYFREVDFPPVLSAYISSLLKDMSDKGNLTEEFVGIYEKFVVHPVPIVRVRQQGLSQKDEIRLVKEKEKK